MRKGDEFECRRISWRLSRLRSSSRVQKAQWEPMRLTLVGNLAAVMQNKTGSKPDGSGGFMKV